MNHWMVNPTKMVLKKIGSCGKNLTKDLASKKGNKTAQHTYLYTVGLHQYVYRDSPPPPSPTPATAPDQFNV